MKSLKESILGDIENNLYDYEKHINDEMKMLNKTLSVLKNYDNLRSHSKYVAGKKHCRFIELHILELLKSIGYDAEYIKIVFYDHEDFESDEKDDFYWVINISITKQPAGELQPTSSIVYDYITYGSSNLYEKPIDIVKKLFKPATANIETFKRFLENFKKNDGNMVFPNHLLN